MPSTKLARELPFDHGYGAGFVIYARRLKVFFTVAAVVAASASIIVFADISYRKLIVSGSAGALRSILATAIFLLMCCIAYGLLTVGLLYVTKDTKLVWLTAATRIAFTLALIMVQIPFHDRLVQAAAKQGAWTSGMTGVVEVLATFQNLAIILAALAALITDVARLSSKRNKSLSGST